MKIKQTGESYAAVLQMRVERHRRPAQVVIGGLALVCAAVGVDTAHSLHSSPRPPRVEEVRLAGDVACLTVCEPAVPNEIPERIVPAPLPTKNKVLPKKVQATPRPVVRASAVPVAKPSQVMRTFAKAEPSVKSRHQVSIMRRPPAPNDISFPQCKLGFPESAAMGIVGINNGHPLSTNPCLKEEVSLYKSYQLYVNADFPGKVVASQYQDSPKHCDVKDEICQAYNYGYSGGVYAVNYAVQQGADSPDALWLDVETGNKWRGNHAAHRANLQGEVDALKQAAPGRAIGFYSTMHMWTEITGGWENGMPGWIASGQNTPDAAAPYCQDHNFTGGPTVMSQYVTQFDTNVIC